MRKPSYAPGFVFRRQGLRRSTMISAISSDRAERPRLFRVRTLRSLSTEKIRTLHTFLVRSGPVSISGLESAPLPVPRAC